MAKIRVVIQKPLVGTNGGIVDSVNGKSEADVVIDGTEIELVNGGIVTVTEAIGDLSTEVTNLETNKLDATTSAVQTTRPLKTVGGTSLEGSGDVPLPASGVQSVTGDGVGGTATDPVLTFPTPTEINLGNVDNTSDVNKPTSTATQIQIDSLTQGQTGGLISFTTLAILQAYTDLGNNDSYKVTNDSTASNNGYYHWSGSAYVKDADLATGLIEEGNNEAVKGDLINESLKYKADLATGKNLFNKDVVTEGFYQQPTGDLVSNASYSVSEYIPVIVGNTYNSVFTMVRTCYFDEYKNVVVGGEGTGTTSFTIPLNVAYVTISVEIIRLNVFQLEEGVYTTYEPYSLLIPYSQINKNELIENLIDSNNTTKGVTGQAVAEFTDRDLYWKANLEAQKNKFDKSTALDGYIINSLGVLSVNVSFLTSDFIPVTELLIYRSAFWTSKICCYDSEYNVVPGGTDSQVQEYTIPLGVVFIKISVDLVRKDQYQLEQNATETTTYEPFDRKLSNSEVNAGDFDVKPLLNKKIICFGDSVTEFGNIPELIGNITGAIDENVGIGGTTMARRPGGTPYSELSIVAISYSILSGDWSDVITAAQEVFDTTGDDNRAIVAKMAAYDYSNCDIIQLFYGTNDWGAGSDIPIGADSSVDEFEFVGAIKKTVENIQTAYPHLRIYFVTPTHRFANSAPLANDSDTVPNIYGRYLIEYSDSIVKQTSILHKPRLNMYNDSGLDAYNHAYYFGTDGVHPNSLGNSYMAERISGFLQSVFKY